MLVTSQKLREEGEYLGFSDKLGYVYKLNGQLYSYDKKGITNITHLEVVL